MTTEMATDERTGASLLWTELELVLYSREVLQQPVQLSLKENKLHVFSKQKGKFISMDKGKRLEKYKQLFLHAALNMERY